MDVLPRRPGPVGNTRGYCMTASNRAAPGEPVLGVGPAPLGQQNRSAQAPEAPRDIPRRAVVSWVLYDLANTIFAMGVTSLYFGLWVRDAVGPERADSVYGVISAISMGLIFIASP